MTQEILKFKTQKRREYKKITNKEVSFIKRLRKEGHKASDIASQTGRTESSINAIISRNINGSNVSKAGAKPKYNNRKDMKAIKEFLSQAWYKRIFTKLK